MYNSIELRWRTWMMPASSYWYYSSARAAVGDALRLSTKNWTVRPVYSYAIGVK